MGDADGELDLIAGLRTASSQDVPEWLKLGIGDDACVMAGGEIGEQLMVCADTVVDGVHFVLDECGAIAAAGKAVKACLSDIAAMGGGDRGWVLACIGFDSRRAGEERHELMRGVRESCARFGFALTGGDIVASASSTFISITAGAWSRSPIRRDTARAGDLLLVSGELGCSLSGKHLDFEPRLGLARQLRDRFTPSSMIDITDGLAVDLGHLCQESGVGAIVDEAAIPLSPAAKGDSACALGDGEDFELLFTSGADQVARLGSVLDGVPVTVIGEIVAGHSIDLRSKDGALRSMPAGHGWEHLEGRSLDA